MASQHSQHNAPAQSPVPPVTTDTATNSSWNSSNISHWNKLGSKGETDKLHFNRLLQWVSQGVKRCRTGSRTALLDGNTTYSTQLCAEGSGEGFLVRGQHCCLWRICLPQGVFQQRARDSQFHVHFPSPPTGNF